MDSLLQSLPSLARMLIGFYFAFFGLWNIYHWTPILQVMIKRNIPLSFLLLQASIVYQVVTGGMIMTGFYVRLAALLLIPFILIAPLIFHPFWQHRGELFRLHFAIFVANTTIALGALLLLVTGL